MTMDSTVLSTAMTDDRACYPLDPFHGEIDQHVDRGKNQDHALDDRIVAPQDRIDGQPPDAGKREHRLRYDGAADQQRDAHADDGHHGDRGILERMADQHLAGREPFRRRGADVVLREHVEHAGARHARDQRDVDGAQRDARQDQMPQPLPRAVAQVAVALHRAASRAGPRT